MKKPSICFAPLAMLGLLACAGSALSGQEDAIDVDKFDVDFLLSYYDQDGDHSPVTGGTGTEEAQVASPVIVLGWRVNEDWTLSADLGIDQISSASIGNIQDSVSGSSIPASDTRVFATLKAARKIGNQVVGLRVGGASEYDYASVSLGADYSIDLAGSNSTIAASLRHYDDTLDTFDLDGFVVGEDDRTTTDAFVTWSQVLGKRTVGSLELFHSAQSGLLSTPFHRVILTSGERVIERLPDSRARTAIGLRLNHSFTSSLVQRAGYRYYSDDWGISAHSLEYELHFRLPSQQEMWVYPILRYHTQSAADYFGETGTFTGDETYWTSDWDLAEIATTKVGLGWKVFALPGQEWLLNLNRFEARATIYDRDDGLQGFTASMGLGWTF